ncbi:hypothetical protein PybrP1_006574 [[Pythium] brassicae (nom. inval.)]|nr:hypothetical protein PybrP1_006574 [[Pythium] brassicae (nom. inval.)]
MTPAPSPRVLQADLAAGRTLFSAVRAGAADSYADARANWQRERKLERHISEARAAGLSSRSRRTFVALVRAQFDKASACGGSGPVAINQHLDDGFAALREIDDHNAVVRNLAAQGAFEPTKRTDAVEFCVGDVVHVKDAGRGVVTGWTLARSHAFADLRVTNAERLFRVPQEDIAAVANPEPVRNPSLLLYFDGFENGRYVASAPLARRFPDDAALAAGGAATESPAPISAPSILQLHFENEAELVQYLRCEDATVTRLVTAALEGRWISASTDAAQDGVHRARELMDAGEFARARDLLLRVVEDEDPEYAYAWAKLGLAEFHTGDAEKALGYYETALEKNSLLLDALTGLGTCATKLRRWDVAHSAAVRLMRLQPDNEVAKVLLENALVWSL